MTYLSSLTEKPSALSVLFLDVPINQRHGCLNALKPGIPAHFLSPHQDGIEQIVDILHHYQQHVQIESVYMVARGTPGCLYIGNRTLSLSTLSHYQPILSELFSPQQFIKPKLCLYGCCVAAGDAGAEFMARLAEITAADMIASSSLIEHQIQKQGCRLDETMGQSRSDSLAIASTAQFI